MPIDKIEELSEVVQSSNINFLFGAGTSYPFLPLLGAIEKNLNQAKDSAEREPQYKEYLTKIMLPNKKIIANELNDDDNYKTTCSAYERFFRGLVEILIRRKSTILSKQVNLFTTNIDVLLETCLEHLEIEYNDGFSGNFAPVFSLANFKKSIHQRSLHFEHISEIPIINILKIHGSLTWRQSEKSDRITFSKDLSHIPEGLEGKLGDAFLEGYKKILVVNPEETKHLESVLNLNYSELLRLYSSELEKENAALFVLGFSMEDRHIREITLRSAKSNPTLRIFVCCSKGSSDGMAKKMEANKLRNIQIFTPDNDAKFTVQYFNEQYLEKVILKKKQTSDESAKH